MEEIRRKAEAFVNKHFSEEYYTEAERTSIRESFIAGYLCAKEQEHDDRQ